MMSGTRSVVQILLRTRSPLLFNNVKLKQPRCFCHHLSSIDKTVQTSQSMKEGTESSSSNVMFTPSDKIEKSEPYEMVDISSEVMDLNTFTLTPQEEKNIQIREQNQEQSVLEPYSKDVSHFHSFRPVTETLAGYANQSVSMQKLADLGVHLYRWEHRDDIMNMLINLDYELQLKKYIVFFHEIVGVPMEDLGPMISRYPHVLSEKIENMKARINYLKLKKFEDKNIVSIITRNPKWLMYKVEEIDKRLGWLQIVFHLTGNEVRALCLQLPKLITGKKQNIMNVTFAVREEMGFNVKETKAILIKHPTLWTIDASLISRNFDYAHNTMKLSHEQIMQYPNVLTTRFFRLKCRHEYLKSLGRDQYDHMKPDFVSLKSLLSGTDSDFCMNVAKTTVETFNLFLKSY